jgi:hypothetical protein
MSSLTLLQSQFQPKKILEVLHKHDVKCVVLGGIAGTLHGSNLPTSDVDICPSLATSDLDRLAAALKELNAVAMAEGEPKELELDWTGRNLKKWLADFKLFNLMTDCGQLDLIHRPAGTQGYKDLAKSAKVMNLGEGVEIRVAALADVIRSKQAAGRQRDLEQLPTLRKLLEILDNQEAPRGKNP